MDRTPPRAPARTPVPDLCPCLTARSFDRLHYWRLTADPSPATLDAVWAWLDSLCLAVELGDLPASGVVWVGGGDERSWIDYAVAGGRVDVEAVTSRYF